MSDYAIFDLPALRELTDGNREIEAELVDLFCKTAESCIERLSTLCSDKTGQWKSVLHEFKGAAANIHADALRELCRTAETIDAIPDARSAALDEIRAAYAQLKPLLDILA